MIPRNSSSHQHVYSPNSGRCMVTGITPSGQRVRCTSQASAQLPSYATGSYYRSPLGAPRPVASGHSSNPLPEHLGYSYPRPTEYPLPTLASPRLNDARVILRGNQYDDSLALANPEARNATPDASAYSGSSHYVVHPRVHPMYRNLEARYEYWFNAPGIEEISNPADFQVRRLLDENEYTGPGFAHVIVNKGSNDRGISTVGVLTCHAIVLRADYGRGKELLMLEHDGGVREPRELLQAMARQARQLGAQNPHFEIIGGMSKGNGTEEGNTLRREEEFMALTREFPIDAVRLHVSHVDVDQYGEDVDGPRSGGVDVAVTGRRSYYSFQSLDAIESESE